MKECWRGSARYSNDFGAVAIMAFVVTVFRMDIKKASSLTAFYNRMGINIIKRGLVWGIRRPWSMTHYGPRDQGP